METKHIFLIIDGNALIHRSYHALPPLTTKSGEMVNAVYGVALTLLSVIEKFHPEYIAASFDLPGPTFRHEKFPKYKATRIKAPDDLYAQIPKVKDLVRSFNIPIYERVGFEADDCVGTLARMAIEADPELFVIIVTGDNDALQLVSDRINVFSLRKGVKDTVLYNKIGVMEKYGFSPEALVEYKGLRGDASDNIPGVVGIGEKGATDLLIKYRTIENIYAHLDDLPRGMQTKLESGRESALLSRELGTIDRSVPIDFDLDMCRTRDFDRGAVEACFRELGFFSLIKRLPESDAASESHGRLVHASQSRVSQKDIREFCNRCRRADRMAFLIVPDTNTLFQKSFSIDVTSERDGVSETILIAPKFINRDILAGVFESDVPKTTFDVKSAMTLLDAEGIALRSVDVDILLAAYLLDAGKSLSLESIANQYLGESISGDSGNLSGKFFLLAKAVLEEVSIVSRSQESKRTVADVLQSIEMPLIPVLRGMERAGIALNGQILAELSREMERDIAGIEREIFDLAGKEFNVSSPRQLAEVLFIDLKIPTDNLKRTKTGISTASSELQKLKDKYPIVSLVEEYRERFKLKSTYLDTLPRLVDSQSRVHTTFHQASTATGRLSSSDPNVQNIPIRGAWGERMRSAFVAGSGCVLVGADYSQIELRVAAHLSKDENMMSAFERGEDIHRRTASLVFGVPLEAVSDEMRRRAKVFNFGILYGMGSFGLSQAAGITRDEASAFIRQYLEHFSGIRDFMESMKVFARKHGYVETELGRRRLIPEILSNNSQIASSAERIAINMPVQGLEADIVKLAMLAVDRCIRELFAERATLLLQIHDELIFEVREDIADAFAHEVKQVMEKAYALSVPLVVDVSVGKHWGEI